MRRANHKLFFISNPKLEILRLTINIYGIDGLVKLADLQRETQAGCLEVTCLKSQEWLSTVPGAPLL